MLRKIQYPAVRRSAATYQLHGTTIPEPFDYLEDPENAETKAFVDAQNACFRDCIQDADKTFRDGLVKQMTELRDYARVGAPNLGRVDKGEYYFFMNPGLLNQSKMMRIKTDGSGKQQLPSDKKMTSEDLAAAETFFDPNTLSEDGTIALGSTGWSKSRQFFAYGLSKRGSDWNEIHVKKADVDGADDGKKNDCEDVVKYVKFSGISWLGDDGFFYTRFPKPQGDADLGTETEKAEKGQVFYHKLGTQQEADVLVVPYNQENPEWIPGTSVSDDEKYIVCTWSDGCKKENLVWIAEIGAGTTVEAAVAANGGSGLAFKKVVNEWTAEYDLVGNDDALFLFKTSADGADNGKIVSFDLAKNSVLNTGSTTTVVKEREWPLEGVALLAGSWLMLLYLENVHHVFYMSHLCYLSGTENNLWAKAKKLDLPIGSVVGWACRRQSPFLSIKMSSFCLPGRSYMTYLPTEFDSGSKNAAAVDAFLADDKKNLALSVFYDEGPAGFNGDDFVVSQHFFPSPKADKDRSAGGGASADGETVQVPVFVCHHKSLKIPAEGEEKKNAGAPCIAYMYGGFRISITPSFSLNQYLWMRSFKSAEGVPAVYCVMNIRGGAEFGDKWYDDGKLLKKINCFNDVEAGAKFLQNTLRLTTPAQTSIMGGSNGGLVVSATMLRAPHLFGAVISQVGVLDMFKFADYTIGSAWASSDYLSPRKNEEDFRYNASYSPLHNVRFGVNYPPYLALSGDHDDRVVPLHSLKQVATLQAAGSGGPLVARIEKDAGHGAGKPLAKVVAESADTYSFIALALGAKFDQ